MKSSRRRYDNNETVDTIENEAVSFIISAFESVLTDIDENLFYSKLINNFKDLIKREIGACKNHVKKAAKQIPLLLKLRKKIKYKGNKSNILIIRLERELNSVKATIRDKNRRIEIMKFALTYCR